MIRACSLTRKPARTWVWRSRTKNNKGRNAPPASQSIFDYIDTDADGLYLDGTGFVVDDPEEIIGDHEREPFLVGTVTATVHVPEVTLTMSKKTMTLKHDNQCELTVETKPAGLTFTDHKIQIGFANDATTYTLASGENHTWMAKVTGEFELYATALVKGVTHESTNQYATVQFPSSEQIQSDPLLYQAMRTEWVFTMANTSSNSIQERGFWIFLNTEDNIYGTSQSILGIPTVPTATNACIQLGDRPADIPFTISPTSENVEYFVASFHTHTSMEFHATDTVSVAGPSPDDVQADKDDNVVGLVFDYVGDVNGEIHGGHPTFSEGKLYKTELNRRALNE